MRREFISWRCNPNRSKSGWDLEAQSQLISYFIEKENGTLIADYEENYIGKEFKNCVKLHAAIMHCKKVNATLIIAKSDLLCNVYEALRVCEIMGENNVYFCDLPHTNRFTLTLFFMFTERKKLLISIRTKVALNAKKDRGETWVRNTDTTKAREVMLKSKRQKALSNPSNVFLWNYLQAYERKCGKLSVNTSNEVWDELVGELNALGQTTATGLEYTRPRLRAAWDKCKNLYYYSK